MVILKFSLKLLEKLWAKDIKKVTKPNSNNIRVVLMQDINAFIPVSPLLVCFFFAILRYSTILPCEKARINHFTINYCKDTKKEPFRPNKKGQTLSCISG
jgi:hypothetical protein